MMDFTLARRMMVDGQVRTQDVTDPRLIAAFEEVPRERFVPAEHVGLAYLDRDLKVGGSGQAPRFLLKPMVLAKLMQSASIGPTDRVLDVGCATGYSSAILARIAGTVVALEEDALLAREAAANLSGLGVRVCHGRLADGAPADAPFDVIIINGIIEQLPPRLSVQLASDGRLVCLEGHGGAGRAMLYRAAAREAGGRPLFNASAPPLAGFQEPASFVF